jgi:NADPH2:quinone reductase
MKAIVLDQFGGPDQLQLKDLDKPAPGPGEVLVRVHATSINPVDTKIREDGTVFGLETPLVLGYDVSGVVAEVGEGVEDFEAGDEVFYTAEITPDGTYAEYHVADADIVVEKPESLSHVEAAAIPLAACTAWQALIGQAQLEPAETVLIHGGGGVGHFAVQIAKAAGAQVVVVGNGDMKKALLDLGADRFVDYETGDFEEAVDDVSGGLGADVVFDTVGDDTLEQSLSAVADGARLVTIVESAAVPIGQALNQNVTVHALMMQRDGGMMDRIATLVETGQLRPLVAETFPLEEAAEAHRTLEKGGVQGKIVLTTGAL